MLSGPSGSTLDAPDLILKRAVRPEVDRAKGDLASAEARVGEANAQLERAKENLGEAGANNPTIVNLYKLIW